MHQRPTAKGLDAGPAEHAAPARRSPARVGAPFSRGNLLRLQREAGNRAVAGSVVQRRIAPEDLAGQMAGTPFALTAAFGAGSAQLAAGQRVVVVTWVNGSTTVRVRVPAPDLNAGIEADVPKKLLRPASSAVAGVAQYGAGLDTVVRDFERGEQAIAAETARKGGARAAVLAQLKALQSNRERLLNRRLIQGSMLNRFDQSISTWVRHYNQTFGFTRSAGAKKALDPDLVKSMVFQETQMGTAGQHLEDPSDPDPKVKTRQNLGQLIDSSAAALLLLIKEEKPPLITKHHLENLEHAAAASGNAEGFMWGDPGFAAAVTEYFKDVPAGATEKNLDYDFWVHAAVRWLFKKRSSTSSWEEAIRAYNGGGARARHYRDEVVARAQAAAQGQQSGQGFVPEHL
ncbi:hypothetical protein [Amycolatopsis sp. NPDC098790]|uniref:hypothetical protein n=1 Tax=Amycolatopsis sp. NPDC098790 TaxID=3363939 RepID=UPI003830B1C2